MRDDESAQIHILEMLTLFWLFFMSATFLIRVHVPDSVSISHDASLEVAGDQAFSFAIGEEALIEGESRLHELLAESDLDGACELLQSAVPAGKEANCWLAKDSGAATPYSNVGTPAGSTVSVHHLVVESEHVWTVTLDVWARGGGA